MATEQILYVRRIRAATIYNLLFIGLVISLVPLGIAFGIAVYFGVGGIMPDYRYLHGVPGLVAWPLIAAASAFFLAIIIGTFTSLGLWFVSLVRPIPIHVIFDV